VHGNGVSGGVAGAEAFGRPGRRGPYTGCGDSNSQNQHRQTAAGPERLFFRSVDGKGQKNSLFECGLARILAAPPRWIKALENRGLAGPAARLPAAFSH